MITKPWYSLMTSAPATCPECGEPGCLNETATPDYIEAQAKCEKCSWTHYSSRPVRAEE